MEPGHSPAQNLPCASKSYVGRPFPTYILKNIQGQILFYPTPAFFWVCTRLTVLRPASLDVRTQCDANPLRQTFPAPVPT